MPHWRTLMESKSDGLNAADLWDDKTGKHREVVVQIDRVTQGHVIGKKGRKERKPFLHLRSAHTGEMLPKPYGANVTAGKTIERIVGSPDYNRWQEVKPWITLYVDSVESAEGGMVDAIRIRPTAAKAPDPRNWKKPPRDEPAKADDPAFDPADVQPEDKHGA